jgi:hypothetical protein
MLLGFMPPYEPDERQFAGLMSRRLQQPTPKEFVAEPHAVGVLIASMAGRSRSTLAAGTADLVFLTTTFFLPSLVCRDSGERGKRQRKM